MRGKTAPCPRCGWRGLIARHNAAQCAQYARIAKLYLAGLSTRAVGQEVGVTSGGVRWAMRACGLKCRPRGGLNNPHGYNGSQ